MCASHIPEQKQAEEKRKGPVKPADNDSQPANNSEQIALIERALSGISQ
ncbi:hypothetical protein OOT00_01625 [Desulfobotulus sp. H1]|uniref:Uncharacterized protein n=1 Tax=Desulfobotulus pelophilus TaxID=2823377 RepID=A0ABT3N5F0_9BACT|nr:hypothetical protein [Desulfobotulus pelophilus]MCW7752682.1 hypothetical protein [Desulfobotulus pelophilus]